MEKSCRKYAPKVSFLILVNNPKEPLHERNSFKNKIFWYSIIKKASKILLYFFFWTQSFVMGKNLKDKRNLEIVTSQSSKQISSSYKTSPEKFLY